MGNFICEFEAVGGHGCQREIKDGGAIMALCGSESCPDCAFVAFIDKLKKSCSVSRATITHWPATPSSVIDVIVPAESAGVGSKRIRRGHF